MNNRHKSDGLSRVLISTYWNVNDIETLGTLADF